VTQYLVIVTNPPRQGILGGFPEHHSIKVVDADTVEEARDAVELPYLGGRIRVCPMEHITSFVNTMELKEE